MATCKVAGPAPCSATAEPKRPPSAGVGDHWVARCVARSSLSSNTSVQPSSKPVAPTSHRGLPTSMMLPLTATAEPNAAPPWAIGA
jgi:hypothetical protein